jgi:hypothetical protein
LDLIKRGWRGLKRLSKGYADGQEPVHHERGGGEPFIENLEN